jgi:hypothetical protein
MAKSARKLVADEAMAGSSAKPVAEAVNSRNLIPA